jgi:hypothetical protein
MKKESEHPDWQSADNFLLGYGSLLSADSRLRFSNNPQLSVSVSVKGFERNWVTRSFDERQTYVGATVNDNAEINAHCIPFVIDTALQKREQDYRFIRVSREMVSANGCQNTALLKSIDKASAKLWICETLKVYPATEDFPIHQSYIDTCLSGCLNHHQIDSSISELGVEQARKFLMSTRGWQFIVNDRNAPKYPRAAVVSSEEYDIIDNLMLEFGYGKR